LSKKNNEEILKDKMPLSFKTTTNKTRWKKSYECK